MPIIGGVKVLGRCYCGRMPPNADEYWNHNTAFHPRLLRAAGQTHGPILDVGCGDGLLVSKLARIGESVIGLDPDKTAVDAAIVRCASLPNVEIRQTGFLDAPLDEETFALITMVATLHHMDAHSALHRAARLLQPGGNLFIVGIPRLASRRDFWWATSQLLRARIVGKVRAEHWPEGIPTALSDLTLSEVRAIAEEALPGAHVKRAPYYRYTLRWTRPQ